jgi:hypothetical protein
MNLLAVSCQACPLANDSFIAGFFKKIVYNTNYSDLEQALFY